MPAVDFKAVRRMCPIRTLLVLVGHPHDYTGPSGGRCVCPIHGGVLHARSSCRYCAGSWYCHKCRRGGDCIDFYSCLRHVSLSLAATDICHLLRAPIPYLARGRGRRRPRNREGAR